MGLVAFLPPPPLLWATCQHRGKLCVPSLSPAPCQIS